MLDAAALNDLRQRVIAGEELPIDQYTEVIKAYRAQRAGAVAASAPATKARAASKAAAAPVDLSVLMAGIGLAKKE